MASVNLGIDTSCLENTSWPGVGNLNFTIPELIRPFYKLGPTSPCIDTGVAIPNQIVLTGETFTNQWFALFPGSLGVVGSAGLRITIGR